MYQRLFSRQDVNPFEATVTSPPAISHPSIMSYEKRCPGKTNSGGTAKPLDAIQATMVKWNKASARLLQTFFEPCTATTFFCLAVLRKSSFVHVKYAVACDLVLNTGFS